MDGKTFALRMIDVAKGYVGIDRETDPEQIGKFLGLLGLPFAEDGVPVSYCAAGVSWAGCHAYADLLPLAYTPESAPDTFHGLIPEVNEHFFLCSASCGAIWNDAQARGTWLSNAESDGVAVQAGWLVLYDWTGAGHPEHIGIVIDAEDMLHTVEFNTSDANDANGGAVELRTRSYDCVFGFVKLY